jgi:proline dehydrogenase
MTLFLLISCLLLLAPIASGQVAASGQTLPEEQNETMLDTLKRMQIKREENEHKKILEKGEQIEEEANLLLKDLNGRTQLPRATEKRLKNIEKFARQIRSDSGGSEDEPLDTIPSNLTETLKQLAEVSERLNANLAKTSRRVISLEVVSDATEVIQLTKLLRKYLN